MNATTAALAKTVVLATALAFSFTGCVKDKMYRTYTITTTEYVVKKEVKEAAKLQSPRTMTNPGSFALYGSTMFMNERNAGIHVIDYSNPASPVNKGFIPIPGNTGVSVKNDVLYADCYCDLVVFQLSQGNQVEYKNAVRNVFLSRMQYAFDSTHVSVIYHRRDTTVTEQYYNNHVMHDMQDTRTFEFAPQPAAATLNNPGNTSVGSSMAAFAIVGDYLYTIDQSNLNTFSLKQLLTPEKVSVEFINHGEVETIFPFSNRLFIGTNTGMFIYDIANPSKPRYLSRFDHARVCDPVIADNSYAFVTLRAGARCGGAINQLDVLDITDVNKPVLVKSYPFSNPHGLSKDRNVLFLCDGTAGLRVIDASDVSNLVTKQTLGIGKTIDVLAMGELAFVMLDNSIRIYRYDQQFNVQLLGSITKN
jgi:hypothetical protein